MKPVKNNKTSKVKSFFFFLLIAILFWGLTKLSRQYTASVDTSIMYTNIPSQMMLDDGNAESISFEITANGFEFLPPLAKRFNSPNNRGAFPFS